jgi:hypothetical protein
MTPRFLGEMTRTGKCPAGGDRDASKGGRRRRDVPPKRGVSQRKEPDDGAGMSPRDASGS